MVISISIFDLNGYNKDSLDITCSYSFKTGMRKVSRITNREGTIIDNAFFGNFQSTEQANNINWLCEHAIQFVKQ